jgi:ubiquinone/menaquinone biosynthesis C-methylase UbiE
VTDISEQVQRVQVLFDLVADTYDSVGVDFFQPIAGALLDQVAPVEGERWLDVGCGRGAVLLRAAQGIGPTGRIVGIDLSANMLSHTRRAVEAAGLTNVDLRVGDAQEPPIGPTEEFDTVTSCLVLFFLPRPELAVAAWRTLLRSGGRVGVTTFGATDPTWSEVDAVLKEYMPQPRPGVTDDPKESPFASDAGVEAVLSDAGFVDVRTVTQTLPITFANAEQWLDFSWSHGQRAMWLSIPEAERPVFRERLTVKLRDIAAPDGSISYGQNIRHTLARQP